MVLGLSHYIRFHRQELKELESYHLQRTFCYYAGITILTVISSSDTSCLGMRLSLSPTPGQRRLLLKRWGARWPPKPPPSLGADAYAEAFCWKEWRMTMYLCCKNSNFVLHTTQEREALSHLFSELFWVCQLYLGVCSFLEKPGHYHSTQQKFWS